MDEGCGANGGDTVGTLESASRGHQELFRWRGGDRNRGMPMRISGRILNRADVWIDELLFRFTNIVAVVVPWKPPLAINPGAKTVPD